MLVVGFSDGGVLLWCYEEYRGRWARAAAFDAHSSSPSPVPSGYGGR